MSKNKVGDEIQEAHANLLGRRVKIIGCAPCGEWLKYVESINDLKRTKAPHGRCICPDIGRSVWIWYRQTVPGSRTLPTSVTALRVLPNEVEILPNHAAVLMPAVNRVLRSFRQFFSPKSTRVSPQIGE